MANTVFQIKRSVNTRTPTALNFGEMAYTVNGDILWIGQEAANTANVLAIGGKRNPGVLTANQAIVVNGNSWINELKTAKITIGTDGAATANIDSISVQANSSQLGASASGSNTELVPSWAIKTYVDGKVSGVAGSPTGANTYLQFNDSGSFGGTAGFTFDKTTNNAVIANSLSVPIINGTNHTINANVVTGGAVANLNSTNIYLNGTTTTVSSNVVSSGAVTNVTSTNLYVNGTTATINANLTVTDTAVTVTANTQAYKANSTVTGLQITGNSTATYVIVGGGASVVNVTPTTVNVTGNTTMTANVVASGAVANLAATTTYLSGTTATVSSNATFSANLVASGAVANIAATTSYLSGTTTNISANVVASGAVTNVTSTNIYLNGTTTTVASNLVSTGAVSNLNSTNIYLNGTTATVGANAVFNANVTIAGDLIVNGTTFTVNVDTIAVEDSIIKMASNNSTTDTIDSGIYSVYGATGAKYTGLFRDASNSGIYTLFTGLTAEPSTTVDTSNATFALGTLLANFTTAVFSANSTKVNITAGSMNTDLSVQDGGTGVSVFANNGVIYGQNTSAVAITSAPTEGQVLQGSAAGVPTFGSLDGGTF